ncbi:hypothetical protein BYT27DRAFT_7190406 [Phlegmacium glaucopus]|nr:hypothetical protein BYT27DRAFT_7190406 [Phlegmacium glaucopus]
MAQDDAKALKIIDRDIARLEESIRSLRSRRNELSPICRLPPEILCKIFSFIEDRTMGQNRRPDSWISFSRVSQQWRSLALSAPELWTNIPFKYPRSKMAKLAIQVDLPYQSLNSRMIPPGSTLKQLFRDIPKSAPQLNTLRINNASPPTGPAFTIQEDFFSDTERLRCVHLTKCKIGWDSRLLIGLTRLTLHNTLKDHSSSSILQFLHALQRMPALTDLDLEDSIPHDSGELSTCPVADLPCLRVLRMSSDVGPMTTALPELTLICRETQSDQFDFSPFLSVLAAKFLPSLVIRSLSLQNLDVIATYHHGLRFKVWSTTTIHDFFRYSYRPGPPRLELVLAWPDTYHSFDSYAKALTATFDAMHLRTLTQLKLSTSGHINSNTWLKTFARLPLLEQVHVKGRAAHSFLDALVYKLKAANTLIAAYRRVSFPRLRYICMDGTDFDGTNLDSVILVDKLMDCLMERYERNAEVQELCLDDCYNIEPIHVKLLGEIVVHVDWDGGVQGLSDEYDSEEGRDYDSDGNSINNDYDHDDLSYGFKGAYYGRAHWEF